MLKQLKLLAIASFLLAIFSLAAAQDGNPYISNFYRYEPALRQVFCIQEGRDNVMFFGSNHGLYYSDSKDWKFVSNTSIITALAFDSLSGRLIVGGENEIGYIVKNDSGIYRYFPFTNKEILDGVFTKIFIKDGHAWFYSEENIIEVLIMNNTILSQKKASAKITYQGMFMMEDNLFLNTKENGLVLFQDSGFKAPGIKTLVKDRIICSFRLDNNKYLIGTENSALYTFNGKSLSRFSIADSTYLRESVLQGGTDLNNSIAFSTQLGGCIIVDKKTGKTINTINYMSGLPDDEIFAIGKDNNSGVWLAHQYGLSRIALKFPVNLFSNYPGLNGIISSVIEFDNSVYVSTNEGIFYLNKKQEFAAREVAEKHPQRKPSVQGKEVSQTNKSSEVQEPEAAKKKPGLFKRLLKVFFRLKRKRRLKNKSAQDLKDRKRKFIPSRLFTITRKDSGH